MTEVGRHEGKLMEGPKTLDQFDIRGRSALVTGAASGIGLGATSTGWNGHGW